MVRDRVRAVGVALAAGLVWASPVLAADMIHLKNGSTIEVEAWRDVGSAVEFAKGGGIIRIEKSEIEKIDGKASRDLKMYSAPPSAAAKPPVEPATLAKQLQDLLRQGDALFAQTVLSPVEKAGAFRRLGDRWREFEVPDVLREAHEKGQRALQMASEAYTAEDAGTAPDIKERIDAARAEVKSAEADLRKAAGQS